MLFPTTSNDPDPITTLANTSICLAYNKETFNNNTESKCIVYSKNIL